MMNAATGYRKHTGDCLYDLEARNMRLKALVIGERAFHTNLPRIDNYRAHVVIDCCIKQGDSILVGQHLADDHGMDTWLAIEQRYAVGVGIYRAGYDSTRSLDYLAKIDSLRGIFVRDEHASILQHSIDSHA